MVDGRFGELEEALLRIGVAPRRVRRVLLELEAHFKDLMDQEISRGSSEPDAASEAHRLLGSNDSLLQGYAAQPELRAWSRRWPALCFAVLPVLSYVALCTLCMLLVSLSLDRMSPWLHRIHFAADVSRRIDWTASIVLLGLFPGIVAAMLALLAYSRRAALGWPKAGIVAIGIFASLLNVSVLLRGGVSVGEIGAGIGISTQSLPNQLARAGLISVLGLVPLWLAMRRARRRYPP